MDRLWNSPFLFGVVGGLAGAFLLLKLPTNRRIRSLIQAHSSEIIRYHDSPRSSAIVVHKGVVYLSGQVGDLDALDTSDITAQTVQTLKKIDGLLAYAGTSKEHILSADIYLKNISTDFEPMNRIWNAWVHPTKKGVRACVEANLARPQLLVEIKVVAALP